MKVNRPMSDDPRPDPSAIVRRLIRSRDRAVLSTLQSDSLGWPYGSLVLVACKHDATPLLFISDLAEHTRNIKLDPRVSLLFDGTQGLEDPLTGARATIMGHASVNEDPATRTRFLARHPAAELYAGFADFHLYSIAVIRAHVVAGFGWIDWVDGQDVRLASNKALKEQEFDIVAHMNDDHADAIQTLARRLLGLGGGEWRMTGCDSEGLDLRLGGETARLDFENLAKDASDARVELIRLVKRARSVQPNS